MLLLALAVLVCAVLPAAATLPPTDATLVSSNSTTLSFSVGIPAGSDADSLRVLVQKAENGNATDVVFPISLPGPVIVDIANLVPNSAYVCSFYLVSSVNGSSDATRTNPTLISTLNVGPQIISFFAADASSDTNAANTDFTAGDTFTIAFNNPTNQPSVASKADIDALFHYTNGNLGAAYTGSWSSSSVLVITVSDPGQSSPPLGQMFINVIGNIIQADGKSDVSRSSSPPLTGSFTTSTFQYFVPIDANGVEVTTGAAYAAYNAQSDVDVPRRIPLDLVFPSGSNVRPKGYGITATIVYPNTADVSLFSLQGANFTTGTSVREGAPTTGQAARSIIFTNEQLITALQGLQLVPAAGFVGFASVEMQLIDRSDNTLMSSVYVNIEFVAPATVGIPSLSADGSKGGNSGFLSDPAGTLKTYKTPLIAALCSVVGFFLLVGLGIVLYKKFRGGRDARDFEGQPLAANNSEDAAGGDGGVATRRFYYDAKV